MRKFSVLAALAASGLAVPAFAGIVVSYDSDIQNGGNFSDGTPDNVVNLDGDGLDDDVSGFLAGHPFETANPMPTPGDYTGPTIYGGVRVQELNSTDANLSSEDSNPLNFRVQTNVDSPARMHGLLFFKTVSSVTFNLDSVTDDNANFMGIGSLEDGLEGGVWSGNERVTVRWAIFGADGNMYLSQSTISNSPDGRILDTAELAAETWQQHDAATEINFDQDTATYATTTAALNGIGMDGFGIYWENDDFTGDRMWMRKLEDFTVEAVIPEPASIALLGLCGLVMVRRCRG